ncbi:21710_t:CDS:2 [Gigaspora margarita]|uniref:21710_t:CDS:1 n=1 Tax=Gigaspora margarita TaxID=4874 RepID=A0ABM8VV87_GIGMA|nr:21710_t:CDS:2 [Gigaspora margarita]
MGYDLAKIEKVVALKIKGSFKSDIQIQVNIFLKDLAEVQNISVKLVSNEKGFNQIDKRFLNEISEKEQEKGKYWIVNESVAQLVEHKFKCYTYNCGVEIVVPQHRPLENKKCPNCGNDMKFEGEVKVED